MTPTPSVWKSDHMFYEHQINIAGATLRRTIVDCEPEDLDWCYNALVRTVFMMTKAAIPHLEKTKGAVINMSSVAGLIPVSWVAV